MKYSLVVATLSRCEELECFLVSIRDVKYDISKVEIIIIDQNVDGLIDEMISGFYDLNILHVKSKVKGLSYNRNVGLKYATGDIVCFPDDDCRFYTDTFIEVDNEFFSKNKDFCIGRIYDRKLNKNILKKWPKIGFKVNKFNSYFIASSITLFVKKDYLFDFDEKLGVGADYGSCEDADFIYRVIEKGAKGTYTPKIHVWHPEVDYKICSLDKVRNYSSGFMYFVRKDTDIIKIILLLILIIKKLSQLFISIFNKKFKHGYFTAFFGGLFSTRF